MYIFFKNCLCAYALRTVFQCTGPYGPAHEILVLIAYAQTPLINGHVDESSGSLSLNVDLSLHCIHTSCIRAAKARFSCTGPNGLSN